MWGSLGLEVASHGRACHAELVPQFCNVTQAAAADLQS